jgi:hypothetical protein
MFAMHDDLSALVDGSMLGWPEFIDLLECLEITTCSNYSTLILLPHVEQALSCSLHTSSPGERKNSYFAHPNPFADFHVRRFSFDLLPP